MVIKQPTNKFKVFANKAQQSKFLPTAFGTGKIISKEDYFKIANENFEFGLESLEAPVTMRDMSNILFYLSNSLGYIYQQGVVEWNPYQQYTKGSLVQYKSSLYTSLTEHQSIKEKSYIECNCSECSCGCGCEQDTKPNTPDLSGITPDVDSKNWMVFSISPSQVEDLVNELNNRIEEVKEIQGNLGEVTDTLDKVEEAIHESVVKVKPTSDFGKFTITHQDGKEDQIQIKEEHITDVLLKDDSLVIEVNKEDKFILPLIKIKSALADTAEELVFKNANNTILKTIKVLDIR